METQTTTTESTKEWVAKPEDVVIYDDTFWVRHQRWGTCVSVGSDGREIITSLTEEDCVQATRFYLKGKIDGFPNESRTYDGVVGGKL